MGNQNKYEIPSSWLWSDLSEVGIVASGGTPSTKESSYWGGKLPWISPADLTGYKAKFISKGRKSITQEGLERSSAKVLPKGTVLFSSRAPIGYVAVANNPISTNQGFKNLIVTDSLSSDYVYHYLKSVKQLAESMASGTTFLEISGTRFGQIPFPLPPLNEQHRIVTKIEELFSELDNGIANLKLAQNQLKVYRQSLLKKAFDGSMFNDNDFSLRAIGDHIRIISGNAFKKSEYSEKGVRLFQIANVSFNKTSWDKTAYLPEAYLKNEKFSNLILKNGDVVMALNRPLLDRKLKVTQLVESDVPAILYQRVGKFVFDDQVNSKYFLHFLQSPRFIEWLEIQLKGVNIPFINQTKLLAFNEFPLPDLKVQIHVVENIERQFSIIEHMEATIEKELHKAELSRQSILKKAFEGRLVEQDPIDEPASLLLEIIKVEKEKYFEDQKKQKKTRKKKVLMKKETLKKTIENNFKKKEFTFEELNEVVSLSYEELKGQLFEMIEEEKGLSSSFSEKEEKIKYKLIG